MLVIVTVLTPGWIVTVCGEVVSMNWPLSSNGVFGLSSPNTSSSLTTVPSGTKPKIRHCVVVPAVMFTESIEVGLPGSVTSVRLK